MPHGRYAASVLSVALLVVLMSVAPAPLVRGTAVHDLSVRMVAPAGLRTHGSAVLDGGLGALSQVDTPAAQRVLRNGGLHTRSGPHGLTVAVSIDVAPADSAAVAAQVARSGELARADAGLVEGYVPLSSLTTLAALPGVSSVAPIRSAMVDSVVSPGVTLLGGSAWQAGGVTGTGIKVGIIDTGFSGLGPLLGSVIPANSVFRCYLAVGSFTSNVTDCAGTGAADVASHGTAVAETVSGTAPGAQLYISNAAGAGSQADLFDTVNWMTAQGVRVINASWGSALGFEGPGDGTSPFSDSTYALIDAAVRGGALWVNAAGNEATGGWSGPLVDANRDSWVEFSGSDDEDTVSLVAGQTIQVDLRWAGPWGASAEDYGVGIWAMGNEDPLAFSADFTPPGYNFPFALIPAFRAPATGTYRIAIKHLSSSTGTPEATLLVQGLEGTQALEYHDPAGTLPTPADSANPGMLTVGAVDVATPSTIEPYSSQGPTTDGRVKPDLVAPDCVPTTQYTYFCGTSQAAPFVSGAAALLLQTDPTLTPAQLAASLRAHTTPLGTPIPNDTFGYGRLSLGAVPRAPAGLAFVAVPQGGSAGMPFEVQPRVQIVDGGGTPVTTGTGSMLPVTLALSGGTGSGTLTCTGGLTVVAVAGVASFSGCSISTEGEGYVLSASTPGLPAVRSAPISVWPAGVAPATLTLASSASVLTWGQGTTLSVHLSSTAPGAALAGRAVVPEVSLDGTTWTALAPLTTDRTGTASLVYRPATNLWYRASYAGAADLAGAESASLRVVVRQIALLRPDSAGTTVSVAAGRRVSFTTTVRPARPELPAPSVTYRVYRLVGRSWSLYREVKVTAAATGVATLVWTFGTRGSWYVTSMGNPTPYNANTVWYARQRYDVF
jgi:subtilisin family serine protease